MESHFVISYDHDTGKFELDNDTLEARFNGGSVWDTDLEDWVQDPKSENVEAILTEWLRKLNMWTEIPTHKKIES